MKYQIQALFFSSGWEIPDEHDFPLFNNPVDAQLALDDYLEQSAIQEEAGLKQYSEAHDWRVVEID